MENHLKAASVFAHLLDNQFSLFGVRFGIAALLELIPEVGDVITLILSLYLIWIALRMELPLAKIIQMVGNVLINFLVGLLPVAGEIFYVVRKANLKNLKILQGYADKPVIEGEIVHRSLSSF